ncbi:cell division cycle-associated 7-like protein [Bombina bombina]|uniref:cell division cycle-associated 7-like protein n=1 Tax=Bombina bombina TaxID=8345 RepID=UPI00235AD329|nr:cell division cycle-associated 7-like protein [Bombina bombina]
MGDEDSGDVAQPGSEEGTRPKRSGFGLRIALQFPNKKSVTKSDAPVVKPGRQNNKLPAKGKNLQRGNKCQADSDSEDDAKSNQENSNALLKRAMNIKENKAMLAQLLAELNSMPELFPVKAPATTPSKPKKTPRKSFTEGQIERRTNPTRNARPPENFALENFTASAMQFAEHLQKFGKQSMLKRTLTEDEREGFRRRRSSKYTSARSVEDITEEELENIAVTVKDKIYDKIVGSTCHQCRQKTVDTKTVCRNVGCGGVRGQFCGPCLRNRYGEDVRNALLDPDWICPPCRGNCNCSYCRKRDGRCATGMLIHLAKFYGYDNVKEYLESLQKGIVEDD